MINLSPVDRARIVLKIEADAIAGASTRLNESFSQAVELLAMNKGKIVVCGMGKSGHIAQKLAATFSSTGSPAVYLHPADAVHGDLGIYCPGDPTIMISKSGSTGELLRLLPILRGFHSPLIGILGNLHSAIARDVDLVIDACVTKEADTLNLAPTASALVALAVGDALATAVMEKRGFNSMDFARIHPGGQLGRNLYLHVADVMHGIEKIACVNSSSSLKDVVIAMTRFPLGAACVLDDNGILEGLITDGDVRRALQNYDDIRKLTAKHVMVSQPVIIEPGESLTTAIDRMENRHSQISVLPVLDVDRHCVGLIRIHDIYQGDS